MDCIIVFFFDDDATLDDNLLVTVQMDSTPKFYGGKKCFLFSCDLDNVGRSKVRGHVVVLKYRNLFFGTRVQIGRIRNILEKCKLRKCIL